MHIILQDAAQNPSTWPKMTLNLGNQKIQQVETEKTEQSLMHLD